MKKIIKVGNIDCGADKMFLICGPCVIEDDDTMLRTAEHVKKTAEKLGLPVIFKSSFMKDNRSSVDYYLGPGLEKVWKYFSASKASFRCP